VRPGLIDHMCREVGLEIVEMRRIRIGRVPMAGLQAGQWRYLLDYERF
jgi:23S rRNA pseudouridine2604 synthase